jgi:hypothetical protein
VSLPFDWDFLQDNLPQEKLAELRRRFMKEWRSGAYTRKEMIEEQNTRFANFGEDMRAAGRNLSTSKLNAHKKKIWDV